MAESGQKLLLIWLHLGLQWTTWRARLAESLYRQQDRRWWQLPVRCLWYTPQYCLQLSNGWALSPEGGGFGGPAKSRKQYYTPDAKMMGISLLVSGDFGGCSGRPHIVELGVMLQSCCDKLYYYFTVVTKLARWELKSGANHDLVFFCSWELGKRSTGAGPARSNVNSSITFKFQSSSWLDG